MPSFKSFDFGRTYINLDRVEQISSHREFLEPEFSSIRMAGTERAIVLELPIKDLLFRLGIPVDPAAEQEAKRLERESAAIARTWRRENLGVRDVQETLLERRIAERDEQQPSRKPVQSECRVSVSGARTARE